MPQLLLELFSEEIPARMQQQAARDLERLIVGGLTERGFLNEGARGFATPRRLTLVIEGLPAEQADMREERKGPKVDAPDQAIQGFLRSTGLTRDQLKVQKDPKGDFYLAVTERKGRPTPDVLAELIPDVIKTFPWPKSQRWGAGDLTWVRPLHSILCTFDGEIVPFTVGTVKSGNSTRGHRFLGNDKFEVRRFDDYVDKLKRNHVILNAAERKRIATAENANNSDLDFAEFNDKTVIYYSWGNQHGVEHLAEAVFNGSEKDFLTGFFP